jgi:hypothetical protein
MHGVQMTIALLTLLALVLLSAIVYVLHRMQVRETAHSADRQSPLPPLDLSAVPPLPTTADDFDELTTPAAPPAGAATFQYGEPGANISPAPESHIFGNVSGNWAQSCNALKNQGRFAEALAVCEANFPQWGAFNQACTVLRAWIQQHSDEGLDINPLLTRLFLTAASASFLHDKSPLMPSLSALQMRELPGSAWNTLPLPYDSIGYTRLRLLARSDHRMMKERWGEPSSHLSVKEYHQEAWHHLLATYGTLASDNS